MIAALLDLVLPRSCAGCGAASPGFCPRCAEALVPCGPLPPAPGTERVVARYVYGGPLARAIAALKYERRRDLAPELAARLAEGEVPGYDAIAPVPLDRRRLLERGFNQAALLAARLPGPRVAIARRPARPQVGLSEAARRANVEALFAVVQPEVVRGARVLVVDDVLTTGSTASALAAALGRAGARSVGVLVLAYGEAPVSSQAR